MPSLSKELRRLLEKTIAGDNGARQIAELGAEQSLRRLAVDRHEPHTSLSLEERMLRTQLRAHGRQLGDKRDLQRGSQSIDHLKQAVAYEHWHRLLFARFLAENELLMHPEHAVALSLDEVKEVALGLGRDWIDVASEYAQQMLLREVFRSNDPALKVPLSPERRLELEKKLNLLPREIFLADDSLGWVYQFWQKDAKDQVNRSEVKIGADEISPVTQLFTEDYMVLFLLENTLGAWWTARRGKPDLAGYQWTYLRLHEGGAPATGTFDGWPKTAKELKVLDPCMGSGHFLTFALPILAHMRVEEESIPLKEAICAVLRENVFGLELDLRCSQIAAFNLALTAWKLAGSHFGLPPLNLACSGLGINAKEEDWIKLAGEDGRAGEAMRRLYSLFKDGPTIGSLIDPLRLKADIFSASTDRILPLLEEALQSETASEEAHELVIAAQGVLAAFAILANRFSLVATNVPYLGRGKQSPLLAEYCAEFHGDAKPDLATCFLDRCLRFCTQGGSVALVTPQNCLFLSGYKKLRERLLTNEQWDFVARLGEHAFESSAAAGAFVALVGLTRCAPLASHAFVGWDVASAALPTGKAYDLAGATHITMGQQDQLRHPDHRLVIDTNKLDSGNFHIYVDSFQGAVTGDLERFTAFHWEVTALHSIWEPFRTAVSSPGGADGLMCAIRWEDGNGELARYARETRSQLHDMHESGQKAWGTPGVAINRVRGLYSTAYEGVKFDNNVAVLIPKDPSLLVPIMCFCQSEEFAKAVRSLDQTLKVTNQTLRKVPFDLDRWRRIADEQYPNGFQIQQCNDPIHWFFDGHPKEASHPLQVAVARLLGYLWPRQTGATFANCQAVGPDDLGSCVAKDGIVCLSSVAGEESAGVRLRSLLRIALGDDYNQAQLLDRKKSTTLEDWLRDEFFEEHCQVFYQRPFVWHVWDGLKDGFHALVHYHQLDHRNMEKLIYSYLGDWLTRQRQDVQNGVDGSDTRLAAAEHLQKELKKILEGEKPYDIFVRWKSLNKQAIGWAADLNDGIRNNIRPWITEARLYKATKPGILRVTPNIKYTKDRGKEPRRDPQEFPWFDGSTDRINDHHLSLAEKRSARGLK
jgi:hypothetical protein